MLLINMLLIYLSYVEPTIIILDQIVMETNN